MKALLAGLLSLFLVGCNVPPIGHVKPDVFGVMRQATWLLKTEHGECSAVIIAPEKVLTAAHCFGPNMTVGNTPAVLLKRSEAVDLMLLHVAGLQCPCVPVALEAPAIDTKVYTIGYPLGVGQVLTEGRVQGDVAIDPERTAHLFIVTSPVVFGNSGGPVIAFINGKAQVVGITSALAVTFIGGFVPNIVPHLAFVVKSEVIKEFVDVRPVQR